MTFKPHHDPSHLYFVTATVLDWKQIFLEPAYADIILNSLDWHRRNGRWSLYAYVVMPNHLHAILKPAGNRTISQVIQSFGSYTAHSLLERMEADGRDDLLAFFARRLDEDEHKAHQVWQPIQCKNVFSTAFLIEKLEYVHNNPIAKHWRLVSERADYLYSSACFYDRGETPVIEVDNVRDWL